LTSIPLFDDVIQTEFLILSENESLVNIGGFSQLKCVGDFIIHGNDILETIPKFNNLKQVTGFSFRISFNAYLKSAEGFQSLEFVNNLLIIEASGWRNDTMLISDFPKLKEISGPLMLRSGVSNINGFNKLEKVSRIEIDGTKASRIVGFESLKEVFNIDIENHILNLEKIDAFKNVELIHNKFRFWNNRRLTDIDGFQKLKKVGGDFNFDNQFEITNIDFLESLISVGQDRPLSRFTLGGSLGLSDCRAIALLMQFGELPDIVNIGGNGSNCNSQTDIVDNADQDRDGVLNSTDKDDDNDGIYDILEDVDNIDVDGDLIPNSLDLNSDNDGCFDVIEAGLDDDNNDGIIGGATVTVDADGLVTSSSMAYLPPNDINGDSVYEFLDFDYTPVINEQPSSHSVTAGSDATLSATVTNADFFQWEISSDFGVTWESLVSDAVFSGVNTTLLTVNAASIANDGANFRLRFINTISICSEPLYSTVVSLEVINTSSNPGISSSTFSCPNDAPFNLFNEIDGNPDPGGYWVPTLSSGSNIFDPASDPPGVYRYYLDADVCVTVFSEITVDVESNNAGIDGNLNICETSPAVDLFSSLGGSPDSGGTWSPPLSSGTGVFNPLVDTEGIYTYTIGNPICGTVSSQVQVEISKLPNPGTNGAVSMCSGDVPFDLFAFLGDNPEMGGIWSPSLLSGTGVFDPSLDTGGIYTYTLADSVCGDVSSQVEVTLEAKPNVGMNGALLICSDSSPSDLFLSLEGSPDAGGVWSPSLNRGNGMFDPSVDLPGIYTYSLSSVLCGTLSSEVVVQVDKTPDAGFGGAVEFCLNAMPSDLFQFLGGKPDTGGVWSPTLISGNGIFDPSMDMAGVYTYTVSNGVCQDVSAQVEVLINELSNPGTNGVLSICSLGVSTDLFTLLGDNPDSGGTWSPMLASGTGIYDPQTDAQGTYRYTINDGLCGSVSSEVTVELFDTFEISDFEIQITDFETNNTATIIISETGEYEYSLDDTVFQSSNTFFDLRGGDYTIYARQIDGCGRLEYEFSVLGYPKFFTPNNDGINDFWQIRGIQNFPNSETMIFDRYGKLLVTILPNDQGWNGIYNGKTMLTNDYWFRTDLGNGKSLSGHFTLKR
jgi:gliding motility-associated-like protein